MFLPYDIPDGYLETGSGEPTLKLTPVTDYKWIDMSRGLALPNDASKDISVSYDEYKDVFYFGHTCQSSTVFRSYRMPISVDQVDFRNFLADYESYTIFLTPDPCPWAKQINTPHYFMNGMLYNYGYSKKYGSAKYATDVENVLVNGNELKYKIGTWWLTTPEEGSLSTLWQSHSFYFYRVTETETKYVCHSGLGGKYGEITIEDSFIGTDGRTYKGKRTINWSTEIIPKISSNYECIGCIPDVPRRTIYYIVYDVTAGDPLKQGYCFLLVYNMDAEVFTEYRDMPPEWNEMCETSYTEQQVNSADMRVVSNALIDLDGSVYFCISARKPGSNFSNGATKINLLGTPVITHTKLAHTSYPYIVIGYDDRVGYFLSSSNITQGSYGLIKSSKNIETGEEKTRDEFFNGNYFDNYIRLRTTTGLIAYDLGTPILVGGYFSTTPEQEIYLNPNAVNYIYFSRDSADREKVNIEVRTRKIGGEKAFNRVLVAEITTDHEKIIAQKNYPIKWDY